MAEDQVTIDPEFRPRRPGPASDRRPGRKWIALASVVAVAALSWLLVGSPSDPEPVEEVAPVSTTEASDSTSSSTTTQASTTTTLDSAESVGYLSLRGGYRAEVVLDDLDVPNDVVFDPDGGLFVSETAARRVSRIEILDDGSFREPVVVATGIDGAEGLALSDDGVLYVSGGTVVYRIVDGVAVPFMGGFDDPEGLTIDANGDLYVADDAPSGIRVSKIAVLSNGSAGAVSEVVVVEGESAADIEFGPTGELFVANSLDAVWVVEFAQDGSVRTNRISMPDAVDTSYETQRALAFDRSGSLYVAGGGSVWLIEPDQPPVFIARGLDGVEGLAFDSSGSLYVANVGGSVILRIEEPPIDASIDAPGYVVNPSTTPPDIQGALGGDSGELRLPLGVVDEVPSGPHLDFLFELDGFRDAVFVHPGDPNTDPDMAGKPFHVAHGFINNGPEPLSEEFDVVMYLTRWSGPDLDDGVFEMGQTYRFVSDYVLRGNSDQCGPTYSTQTAPQTCEWFVHEFPDGLPEGRYDLWAVWQAPCSGWVDLGFADSCLVPSEVVSLFSSGVNSGFGDW